MDEGAGEVESATPGSGVVRSGDRTQRKAAGSAGSAVGEGIAAAASQQGEEKEKCVCYLFLGTMKRSRPGWSRTPK
jgi:hypothetical protein